MTPTDEHPSWGRLCRLTRAIAHDPESVRLRPRRPEEAQPA